MRNLMNLTLRPMPPTFAHSELAFQLRILSLQVVIGSSSLIQFLSNRLVSIKQSTDRIKQVIYPFLVILTFHIRQLSALYR